MTWVSAVLGPTAIIEPGLGLQDRLRAAIQHLSRDIAERRVHTHTGWWQINGEWGYLHGRGALGAHGAIPGIETALDDNLARYELPDPPQDPEARRRAIRASLRLLDLTPVAISGPGLVYTYRSALSHPPYALGYVGRSGAGKSPMQACFQQHYGATMKYPFSPAYWFYTDNVLADLQFQAKDALLPIDDFVPGGTQSDRERWHSKSARVIRGQANSAGRRRMRRDGTLAPDRPPRSGTMWTGEDALRGESLQVRSLTLGCYRGMMDRTGLTACQRDANAGWYAESMALFIQWLAPRRAQILAAWDETTAAWLAELETTGHPRTPTILADLAQGWHVVLEFARDMDAITPAEREQLWERVWVALCTIGAEQSEMVAHAEAAGRSLRLLSAAVASAQLHLVNLDDTKRPAAPERYGWREQASESADNEGRRSTRTDWRAGGRQIGYVDAAGEIYLEPEIAFAAVQRLADEDGEGLGVGFPTWKRRLYECGVLASTETDGDKLRFEVRRTVADERRRVLHIRSDAWHFTDAESASDHPHMPQGSPSTLGKVDQVDQRADSPDFSRRGAGPLASDEEPLVGQREPVKNKAEVTDGPPSPQFRDKRESVGASTPASEPSPAPAAWRGTGPFLAQAAKAGVPVTTAGGRVVVFGDREPFVTEVRRHQAEILAMLQRPPCHTCKGITWWVSTAGGVLCRQCKPPYADNLVAMTFDTTEGP
jgi:hypothetical protein